jgi:metacaspase-1
MKKKALVVGINDYPGSQNDLQGCINDSTNIYDVLVKYFDFAPAGLTLLSNSRATRKAILEGLKTLVSGASAGDTLVFHYSGHGSQVRDTEGDELKDGMDEIICPWDFDWDGTYIKDDDLAALFAGLARGIRLEVILDSCHSGTGTRELIVDRTRLAAGAVAACSAAELWSSSWCIRPRYLPPPPDIALRADEVFAPELPVRRIGRLDGVSHVLWAACRANQYSADAEIGGRSSGAFTYFFCKHIRDCEGRIGRAELLKRVRASLKHEGFSQVPQLECPEDEKARPVFS